MINLRKSAQPIVTPMPGGVEARIVILWENCRKSGENWQFCPL